MCGYTLSRSRLTFNKKQFHYLKRKTNGYVYLNVYICALQLSPHSKCEVTLYKLCIYAVDFENCIFFVFPLRFFMTHVYHVHWRTHKVHSVALMTPPPPLPWYIQVRTYNRVLDVKEKLWLCNVVCWTYRTQFIIYFLCRRYPVSINICITMIKADILKVKVIINTTRSRMHHCQVYICIRKRYINM